MLGLLYAALEEPLGISVRCSDRDRARPKFYAARRAAGDPALDALSFICPAHEPNNIWIMKARDAAA